MGTVDVLNCGSGHLKFSFDSGEVEAERASRVVQDMLRRGYALFIEGKAGKMIKVKSFDPKTREYIIADGALYAGDEEPKPQSRPSSRKGVPIRLAANRSKVTGVAPTAGG